MTYTRRGDDRGRGIVDVSGGDWSTPTFAPIQVFITDDFDPATGLPTSKPEGSGFVDPLCLRFHDLARELPNVGPDRRLAVQIVVDYDAAYEDPREPDPSKGVPPDAPFGQAENFTSLNRSTRLADEAGRVALLTSLARLIGSEDGRDAVALAIRGPLAPEIPPLAAGGEVPELPEGVRIDGPGGFEGGNAGGGTLRAPRVMVGGSSFFGSAAVEAAKEVARDGGSAADIAAAASAAARGLPPPTRERGKPPTPPPTKPAGSVAPSEHPLGYVWDETQDRIGLAGTLLQAGAVAVDYFKGREGTPINRLAIRVDGHFALDEAHTGSIAFRPSDVASIPETTDGNPVKGWMAFDSSLANQSTEVGQETGKWRPVVFIKAEDIKPPPPPQPPPHVEPPRVQPPPPVVPPEQETGPTGAGPDPGDTGYAPWAGLLPDPAGGPRNIVGSGAPGPAQSSTTGTTGHPGVTMQGGYVVLGGEADPTTGVVQGGKAYPVDDTSGVSQGNTATAPLPPAGSPAAPTLDEWLAWAWLAINSVQVMALGAFGGGSFLNASLGVVSKGPQSQSSVIGEHAQALGGAVREVGGALNIVGTLEADAGSEVVATADAGVVTITQEHVGSGSVRDERPMLLLVDAAGIGDLIAVESGVFGVARSGALTAQSVSTPTWGVEGGVQTLVGVADDPSVTVPDGQALLYLLTDGTLRIRVGDTSSDVAGAAGATALADLSDVDVSGVAASSILSYEGGIWIATNNPTFDSLNIVGKLTVGGMIDPTGLQLTVQASNPGGLGLDGTIWWDGDFLQVGDGGTVDIKVGYNDWARNTSATAGADYVRKLYRRLDTGTPADGIAGLVGYYVDRTAAGADTALGGFYFGWDSVSTPSGYYRWTLPTSANGTEMRLSDATRSLLVTSSAGGQLFLGAVTSTPTAPAASVAAIYTKDGSDLFHQAPDGTETDLLAGVVAPLTLSLDDAVTNAVTTLLTLAHTSTGTPAAGLGAGVDFALEDASGNTDTAGSLDVRWTTATHGNESAALVFSHLFNGSAREGFRFSTGGLLPGTSDFYDIGSTSLAWGQVHTTAPYVHRSGFVGSRYATFIAASLTDARAYTLPDATGTLALTSDIPSLAGYWSSSNDGAGSGLDADLLDGQQGSYYLDPANLSAAVGATKGGTGQATVAAGDLLYGSASDTWSRLAAGSDGDVLTLASGVPSWVTPAASVVTREVLDNSYQSSGTSISYTVAAGKLAATGDRLVITYQGEHGAGGRVPRVSFGATSSDGAGGTGGFTVTVTVIRTGATTQDVWIQQGSTSSKTTAAETLSGTVTITCTFTNTSGATANALMVEYVPAV